MNQKELKEKLHYCEDTGHFTNKKSGRLVGYFTANGRRILIGILGKNYYAHILAFLYVNGKFPEHKIRHLNNCTFDNRWSNLVETSIPKAVQCPKVQHPRAVRSKVNKWWIDQNGNKWSTKRLMKKYSKTMTNCYGCVECHNCHGCKDCYKCVGCVGCTDCYECKDCYGCISCTKCTDCYASIKCIYCTECHDCIECINCNDQHNHHFLTGIS